MLICKDLHTCQSHWLFYPWLHILHSDAFGQFFFCNWGQKIFPSSSSVVVSPLSNSRNLFMYLHAMKISHYKWCLTSELHFSLLYFTLHFPPDVTTPCCNYAILTSIILQVTRRALSWMTGNIFCVRLSQQGKKKKCIQSSRKLARLLPQLLSSSPQNTCPHRARQSVRSVNLVRISLSCLSASFTLGLPPPLHLIHQTKPGLPFFFFFPLG